MICAYENEIKHAKDELAVQFLPAVKAMAFRLKERLPSSVDFMDLYAIGTEELVKLARKYDKKQNDSFWGYAKTRTYGAMLDYLRSLDVVSRANRKLIKKIDKAIEEYLILHNQEPTDDELAAMLPDEGLKKIHQARIASEIFMVMPLEDQLQEADCCDTMMTVEREQLIEIIENILSLLTQREQMVIQLYYFEELTLREISAILNITESRISQIHKSVIKQIKNSLGV